jgi:hypothetical protein
VAALVAAEGLMRDGYGFVPGLCVLPLSMRHA